MNVDCIKHPAIKVIDETPSDHMHKQWSSNPVINRRPSQESTHSNHSTTQLLKEDTIDENEPYIDGGRLSPVPRMISSDSLDSTTVPTATETSQSETADVLRMIIRLQQRQKQHNQLIERELQMLQWKLQSNQ